MYKKALLITVFALFALLLSACAGTAVAQTIPPTTVPGSSNTPPLRTISVMGTGKVFLSPDVAYVTIGVHSENKEATAAVRDNTDQSTKVIDAVKKFGVDSKDVQTMNFNIYPRQDYDTQGKPQGITYVVDNTVYVTVHKIDQVGDLLDKVVEAGANSIQGIQFDAVDRSAALADARDKAVADASSTAQQLAKSAGVTLGPVQSISTAEANPTPVPMYEGNRAALSAPAAAPVPVSTGQLTISVDVSIVYTIQ